MLVQNKFNNGDIITIKLVTGEEVITRFIEETTNTFIVNKPMVLVPTQKGNFGIMPLVFSGDINTNVPLQKTATIMVTIAKKEVASEYTKEVSGIKLASSLEGITNARSSS